MIKILLHGCNGKMGKAMQKAVGETFDVTSDMVIIAGVDKVIGEPNFPFYQTIDECLGDVDIVVDFSHHTTVGPLIEYCLNRKLPVVIATTGMGDVENDLIASAANRIPIFRSANMSLGVNVIANALKLMTPALEKGYDIEIVERHHNRKVDSPSGTAILLADAINGSCEKKKTYIYGRHGKSDKPTRDELGIHAVRGGTIPGEHTILFAGDDEIIEVRHMALSNTIFANGTLVAVRFLYGKPPGLYSMEDAL